MKLTNTKNQVIIGKVVNIEEETLVIADERETFELPVKKETYERLEKCSIKEGTTLLVYVSEGEVTSFMFNGRQRFIATLPKKDNPSETYNTELNVFIGRAAKISDGEKNVQVSLPVQRKDSTDGYNLNLWRDEENDLASKALLELSPGEDGKKVLFWAVTGAPSKFKNKDGKERTSYSVREFATYEYVGK